MSLRGKRNRGRGRARWMAGVMAGVAGVALGDARAWAQADADPRVNMQIMQDGRLLDAAPTLGGSRINAALPGNPLYRGNMAAVGLLRYGQSLRINSPIPSSTSFRASLGSASLYGFRRDSVSVADLSRGGIATLPMGQPYFEPGVTVPSVGFLRATQGTAQPPMPGMQPLDLRIDYGTPYQQGLVSQIVGIQAPRPTAAASAIFGFTQPPEIPLPETPELEKPWLQWERPAQPEEETADDVLSRLSADSLRLMESPLATPLDVALEREAYLYPSVGLTPAEPERPEVPIWAGSAQAGQMRPGLLVPAVPPGQVPREAAEAVPPGPRITDPSLLPRFDLFNDLRMALALQGQPQAEWFEEMMAAAERQPELERAPVETSPEEAALYLGSLLANPLSSFVGRGATSVNDELLKAESLMDIGRYYEASERYEMAHLLDPANPLPLIGKGHALLAAGEYRSAAFTLLQGLQRFPELARVPLDLTDLMGGGEIVDIRRADLMERLAQRERPELRFLLGYLEVHTGLRERGLANLRQAAEHPEATYTIVQYPSLLTGAERETPGASPDGPGGVPPAESVEEPAEPEAEGLRIPPPARAAPSGGAQ